MLYENVLIKIKCAKLKFLYHSTYMNDFSVFKNNLKAEISILIKKCSYEKNQVNVFYQYLSCLISSVLKRSIFLYGRIQAYSFLQTEFLQNKKCATAVAFHSLHFLIIFVNKGMNQRITTKYGSNFGGTVSWSALINWHFGCTQTLIQKLIKRRNVAICVTFLVAHSHHI